jgi:hypothetical protein
MRLCYHHGLPWQGPDNLAGGFGTGVLQNGDQAYIIQGNQLGDFLE